MPVTAVIGGQWGDEGKGKIVDILSEDSEIVARATGGNNAGHTVVNGKDKIVLHLIPSGILHPKTVNIMGNGMVIDPEVLLVEMNELKSHGIKLSPDRLKISDRAHVILPQHRKRDQAEGSRIGTTGRGIGPCYADKASRTGIRMGAYVRDHAELRPFVMDTVPFLGNQLDKKVLAEGAQGTLLDIDLGTYPFVTSSNSSIGGICTGLGIPPQSITQSVGIFKAYCTRVGEGPFPTELKEKEGEKLRAKGGEYGATTGRPRRCGWFDAVAAKHAMLVNGFTEIALTKLDVLSGNKTINICTSYSVRGEKTEIFPSRAFDLLEAKPVYEQMPGWQKDISACLKFEELPKEARDYVLKLESIFGAPIKIISVGPERGQTILR